MAEKVTIMKLKVDLECQKCCKKVKKLLGKYPQIRDQKFDEKDNIVIITVVCCSPEKIRDKLCYKGGGSIKSIEIVEPPKPKSAEPEKKKEVDKPKAAEPEKKKDAAEKPKADPPKKEAEKSKPEKKDGGEKPKAEEKKKDGGEKPKSEAEKKKEGGEKPKAGPEAEKPKDKAAAAPAPLPVQPHIAAPMAVPVGMLYAPAPCYEGRPVGPCYEYGGPVICYDGYYARPVYDSYGGGGRLCYANRCDQYFSEENPSGCIIM